MAFCPDLSDQREIESKLNSDEPFLAGGRTISADDVSNGVVFRTPSIECIYRDRGGDTLLVTFNEMGMTSNGRNVWGSSPAEKINASIFGFVSTQPNWFPAADMHKSILAFWLYTSKSQHKRVVALGLSQGAYAALKYHRRLGVDISIAFSPQISIDPDDIDDPSFNRYFDASLNAAMQVKANEISPRCFVLYDPYDPYDEKHARRLESLGNITSLRLPFVGHASVRIFLGSQNLSQLIEACFAGDVSRIRAVYAKRKHTSADRPHLIAHVAAKKHVQTTLAIFNKYGRATMDRQWLHTCWALGEAGFAQSVLGWLQAFVNANPSDDAGREALCLVAIRADRRDLAIELAQDLHNANPADARRLFILNKAREL